MKIQYFKMEHAQSQLENVVDYNLSESDVDSLSFDELVREGIKELNRDKI